MFNNLFCTSKLKLLTISHEQPKNVLKFVARFIRSHGNTEQDEIGQKTFHRNKPSFCQNMVQSCMLWLRTFKCARDEQYYA